jgi:hypothetical protein
MDEQSRLCAEFAMDLESDSCNPSWKAVQFRQQGILDEWHLFCNSCNS